MRAVLVIPVLALSLATQCFAQQSVTIVEPGEFHGEDVSALNLQDNQIWLGLFHVSAGYIWHKAVVQVETVRDEMVDEENGPASGKRISIESMSAQPLFLIRGMDGLEESKVLTVKADLDLVNGTVQPLTLADQPYLLAVTNPKTQDKSIAEGSAITLSLGEMKQELFSVPDGANEPSWRLLWAGDLDGDGKLDLYLDISDHYNISDRKLFLSSQSEPGKLVKQVAHFSTTGC